MPRTVDHEERRALLTDAFVRVAVRRGLHAVTLRAVAAEAGVSLRLVQYWFGDRAHLVAAALERLEGQSHRRWAARLAALPQPVEPRAHVEALLAEALPADGPSRDFHLVWTACAVQTMTGADPEVRAFADGPDRLERRMVAVLEQAAARGLLAGDADPELEAARLLNLAHGLGTGLLAGRGTTASAARVLEYHLDRLFPASPAPGR